MMGEKTLTSQAQFQHRCEHSACRGCDRMGLKPILDLGAMPPSDGLLTGADLQRSEPMYPLELAFCDRCSLVQILETVPPEELFSERYLYYSSYSPALLEHAKQNVESLIDRYGVNENSFVVEVASNDGYLLQHFRQANVPVLGVDPAPSQAGVAQERGVPTLCAFFDTPTAQDIRTQYGSADIIIANNVLAHVAETNEFVNGLATLLAEDGTLVIEVPYVRWLIERLEFDTIYHEHLCYFSVTSVDRLLRRHGLYLVDLEKLSIHGGSLRLHVQKHDQPAPRVQQMLAEEQRDGVTSLAFYEDFGQRVETLAEELRDLLEQLKARGERIAAYGAAAKGTILLNYIGLNRELIDFVVDRNDHKHGRYMPGVHLPIRPVEELITQSPDYTLILAWNFAQEILQQQEAYRRQGGRFIVPIPQPQIV